MPILEWVSFSLKKRTIYDNGWSPAGRVLTVPQIVYNGCLLEYFKSSKRIFCPKPSADQSEVRVLLSGC